MTQVRSAAVAVGFVFSVAVSSFALAEKIPLKTKDDLPIHTFQVRGTVEEIMGDETQIKNLAAELRQALESDLETYDIEKDETTLKQYYSMLGSVAVLEGRWADYLRYLDERVALETKDAVRMTMGLTGRAVANVASKGTSPGSGGFVKAVEAEYARLVKDLPYGVVYARVQSMKAGAERSTPEFTMGGLKSLVDPVLAATGGQVDKFLVSTLIGSFLELRLYKQADEAVAKALGAYIAKNRAGKPDIWKERDFELTASDNASPVVMAVWDTGVDMEIFRRLGLAWVNRWEIEDNGKDDDGNGFVDDVHGIAYDLNFDKTPELLYWSPELRERRAEIEKLNQGFIDQRQCIDSPEMRAFLKKWRSLQASEVEGFMEDIGAFGGHSHGTHVAGIAVRGNPFARIMAARITYDHKTMTRIEPTISWACRSAIAYMETVEYFKTHGVRAVNMSWGEGTEEFEGYIRAHARGRSPHQIRAAARAVLEIKQAALRYAMQSAPGILFVTSAGNADTNTEFEIFIPSSFDLPNLLTVGAVDQSGDETSFTSFGRVDVYANGFRVMSYVPGGNQLAFDGTSMSSPNVMNLAGKLFALEPELTAEEVKAVIIETAEEKKIHDRVVRLMHPKNARAKIGR